jgi:hypothetical protein
MMPAMHLARLSALILVVGACTDTLPPLTGTQSLEVELISPTTTGDVDNRLPDTARTVVVNVTAKDAEGAVDTSFADDVRVYAQFLGTLTPGLGELPLSTITMTSGVAMNQMITLPPSVLGSATLWFDNGSGLGPDYAYGAVTGTSPTLWYRDPFIRDLQTPRDEKAVDALSTTPLQDKQVRVAGSRNGASGLMVVTSTFAQGYTASDVACATGLPAPAPPCTTGAYDHVMVFTFSSPRDQFGRPIQVGTVIESFAGGLSEFNGLTEIGFPRTFVPNTKPSDQEPDPLLTDPRLLPPPVPFSTTWFRPLTDGAGALDETGRINFERNEAGAIELRDVTVCPLDEGPDGVYTRFKQWTIDPSVAGDKCASRDVINVITAGSDFVTDPRTLVGRRLPRMVGIVRPVSIGSFNVWIIYPRSPADLVASPPPAP